MNREGEGWEGVCQDADGMLYLETRSMGCLEHKMAISLDFYSTNEKTADSTANRQAVQSAVFDARHALLGGGY